MLLASRFECHVRTAARVANDARYRPSDANACCFACGDYSHVSFIGSICWPPQAWRTTLMSFMPARSSDASGVLASFHGDSVLPTPCQ